VLSPIIQQPVFESAGYVTVTSIEAGVQVELWTQLHEGVRGVRLGAGNATGGSITITLDRPLKIGETLTAVAEEGAQRIESGHAVVQWLPEPLPAPICYSTLYVGSHCVNAWGVVPGSTVSVFATASGGTTDLLGEEVAIPGNALVGLSRPLTESDSVSLRATMGTRTSDITGGITPTKPHGSGAYAEKLPPPRMVGPLLECQQVAVVRGLLPGGRFWVYADSKIEFDHCAWNPSDALLLADQLKQKQSVAAQQAFETLNLKSDLGEAQPVGPAKILPAPRVLEPIFEGDTSVILQDLLNSAKIEVAVFAEWSPSSPPSWQTVGRADYAGVDEFGLAELVAGQMVRARQALCGNWGPWSKEASVRHAPQQLAPPKVTEPLYACANHVSVEGRCDGAFVNVFAEVEVKSKEAKPEERNRKVFLGKAKLSWVPVLPHLLEGWTITATQSTGRTESLPSQPVPVKAVPDLPPPKWRADQLWSPKNVLVPAVDACAGAATFEDVLPGAQVNVFWNKLLIGSAEAPGNTVVVPLLVKLQPGSAIHANQSLCANKSSDSQEATPFGKLAIAAHDVTGRTGPLASTVGSSPSGAPIVHAMVGDNVHVPMVTRCLVFDDLKVGLSSTNQSVAKPITNDVTILRGKSRGEIVVAVTQVGETWLSASAINYDPVPETWDLVHDWKVLLQATGAATLSQTDITITVGGSFELSLTIHPVPVGRKVGLAVQAAGASVPFTFPPEVIIPAGTDTGKVVITGVSKGVEWIDVLLSPSEYLDPGHPGGGLPRCRVTVADPLPIPPAPQAVLVRNDTWIEPSYPEVSESFIVWTTFSNTGTAPTGPFKIRWELDGGVDKGEYDYPSLAAMSSDAAWWKHGGLSAGDHYVYVYFDYAGGPSPGYVGFTV
jgi:hypothetical protein